MEEEYKQGKANLIETIEAECPHCNSEYKDREPGWRDKAQEDGLSFQAVRCQKCKKLFRLNYN